MTRLTIEPLDVERDAALLHQWVTHPRSSYWQMVDSDVREVAAEYRRIADDPHHQAFLGRSDGNPQFLVETYDPAHSELAGSPELASGDLGMHVLVAPTEAPIRGFTSRVFRSVMEFCFADPDVARVVVEPDVGNERILAMNAAAGFTVARKVELATKTAALSFCSRQAFAGSRLGPRELAVVAPRAGSYGRASRQLWPREGTSAAAGRGDLHWAPHPRSDGSCAACPGRQGDCGARPRAGAGAHRCRDVRHFDAAHHGL